MAEDTVFGVRRGLELHERHVKYFLKHLQALSHQYVSLDTSRMTAVYFCVVGLDMLRALETALTSEQRYRLIEWVYSNYVGNGFRGGTWLGECDENEAHLAMTYTALATLETLGDDLSRIDRGRIKEEIVRLRQADGSTGAAYATERDLRFTYCACAIMRILKICSEEERHEIARHIDSCRSHEGGYGLIPQGEAHGGSTYCAVAALALLGLLPSQPDTLIDWCARKQQPSSGMSGRCNKPPDSCYSFWIGAVLRLFSAADLIDHHSLERFVFSCESKLTGGFAKYPTDAPPDLLHSFYSLCSLSWTRPALHPINPLLGICEDRYLALLKR